MAPKKQEPIEEGPAELFTSEHAADFEYEYKLPPGSVTHAYRVRFGEIARLVLTELLEVRPTVDAQGNIIWPPLPTLKRSNALAGSSRKASQEDFEMAIDPSDEDDEPLPPVAGPGLKRSNAVRGRRARTPSPTPVPLQRRGAIRKSYNPVAPASKWAASIILDSAKANAPLRSPSSDEASPRVRRITRSGRGSKQTSPTKQTNLRRSPTKKKSPTNTNPFSNQFGPYNS